MACATGVDRHPPVYRFRLCLEQFQWALDQSTRSFGQCARRLDTQTGRMDFHRRHRSSRPGGGLRGQVAGAGWAANRRHSRGPLLGLLYLGYGVIGGCGLGLGYVSPVSTLIKWFPDRRGMATGLAIMGFGGGAMIGAPLIDRLVDVFHRAPVYLGPRDA